MSSVIKHGAMSTSEQAEPQDLLKQLKNDLKNLSIESKASSLDIDVESISSLDEPESQSTDSESIAGVENLSLSINNVSEELAELVKRIARDSLQENETTKELALKEFRQWCVDNKDAKNIITEDQFLLCFLRKTKYNLPKAEQMLMNCVHLKYKFPQYFTNLDFLSPSINELINNGYLFASPVRDKLGRRVTLAFPRLLDHEKYVIEDVIKLHALTHNTILCDEITQICGAVHFADFKDVSKGLRTYVFSLSPLEYYKVIKCVETSEPLRHKGFHYANVPKPFRLAFDVFKSTFLKKKLRNRVKFHNSIEDAAQFMDPKIFPKEFGGVIPLADMIEMWKVELMQNRDKLLTLDQMELTNHKYKVTKKKGPHPYVVVAVANSLRKLEID